MIFVAHKRRSDTMENLPRSIEVRGKICKPIFGMDADQARAYAKLNKLKYKTVRVMSRNLRGKRDLHGSFYRPSIWVFVEVTPISKHADHQREPATIEPGDHSTYNHE